ncbi:hypothetical protein H0H92_006853 [Tricholoma furcatifolium]|nr:hypothetical protein H0H92_006853 [Tricholoma furcatifolium]
MEPSLPEPIDESNAISSRKEIYRSSLVQYHYIKCTEKYNKLHHTALTYPKNVLRRRHFEHASDPWLGETIALKPALIDATKNWEDLADGDLLISALANLAPPFPTSIAVLSK